jgi:hypothetical protein
MAALAGCASFGSHSDPPPVDPNIYPADYKAIVMTFIQTDPYLLVGTQDAALSPPALQPVGTESRYFSCLRLSGPKIQKEKLIVFFSGKINQFVDATADQCHTAAYQPYPELPALLAKLSGSKK